MSKVPRPPGLAARRLSRALIVAGVALVAVALGARTMAVVGSEAGLVRFRQMSAAANAPGGWRSLAVDRHLWAPKRAAAWEEALVGQVDPPLASL